MTYFKNRAAVKVRQTVDPYREVMLACGHPGVGQPTLSSPDRWHCSVCRSFQRASRKKAA